jgi:hypothetical protein
MNPTPLVLVDGYALSVTVRGCPTRRGANESADRAPHLPSDTKVSVAGDMRCQ